MALNEIQTNVNHASAYSVKQNSAKTINTNITDTAKEQNLSKKLIHLSYRTVQKMLRVFILWIQFL